MAVTESWMSQEAHETKDGTTLTRVFDTTWSDWLDGTFNYFVGDELEFGIASDEMRITDIRITARDNVNVRATVLYSTEATVSKQNAVPDVKESWQETLDLGVDEIVVDQYAHLKDPNKPRSALLPTGFRPESNVTYKDWNTVWKAYWTNESETHENLKGDVPELIFQRQRATYTITAYASTLFIRRVLEGLGKINSNPFMSQYFSEQEDVPDDTTGWSDVGYWLFKACPIERVRHNCWRYDFTFEFDWDGWNYQHGLYITTDNPTPQTNLYSAMDFPTLLYGMRATTVDSNIGTGGRT